MATPTNLPASFTAGEILTAANMNLIRGGFRILQVVAATTTTITTSNNNTYIDTTLTASITPQFTSSKILVIVNHAMYSTVALLGGNFKLLRGATLLQQFTDMNYNTVGSQLASFSTLYLDSPASTSAQTYKTQQAIGTGTGQFLTQVNNNPGNIVLMEISA